MQHDVSLMKKSGRMVRRGSAHLPKGEGGDTMSVYLRVRDSLVVLLCVAIVAVPCVVLYRNPRPIDLLSQSTVRWRISYNFRRPDGGDYLNREDAKLKKILRKAAMPDNTVIITTLNRAWATQNSMIDLFLESFRAGDSISSFLNHLVIVALDEKAYDRCEHIHAYCFMLKTEGVDFSGEKYFMTDDYLKMMWRRIDFLRTVLEMGFNFVFTDADIMWFRDPFLHFSRDMDFQIACDHFNGNPADLDNRPNGGFNYVNSNNRTIEFYKYWYMSRELYPGNHDQDVLNIIKYDEAITEMGLKIRFLDTAYFGGLCEPSRDLNKVCTMHVNCCYGLNDKLHDVRLMLDDWKHFQSMTVKEKRLQPVKWRVPLLCRKKP
ncbi:hypothetical protein SUGI_1029510 [Cryptomeria japonica]|uniref:uncharacterized protein At4g15970 n=1 Tax=Cryptomeria japonica TaxID=3369 RepID=UPI002414ABF6|nr:uncharacterized protein At4g15970 [Cryptomeria japonica]GLJ48819.1 hypothetical protein SUGI_1029510 [Cryptomeria japonica]